MTTVLAGDVIARQVENAVPGVVEEWNSCDVWVKSEAVLDVCRFLKEDSALGVPSVRTRWQGADFQEREVYDLMGISFSGHPNMKRLMLWEGFPGHPQRKDYLEPPR